MHLPGFGGIFDFADLDDVADYGGELGVSSEAGRSCWKEEDGSPWAIGEVGILAVGASLPRRRRRCVPMTLCAQIVPPYALLSLLTCLA
jgi:hypothetical protein